MNLSQLFSKVAPKSCYGFAQLFSKVVPNVVMVLQNFSQKLSQMLLWFCRTFLKSCLKSCYGFAQLFSKVV